MTELFGWTGLVALVLLAYAWIGYPIVKRARAAFAGSRRPRRLARDQEPVTVVVATREPPEVVRARIENLRESDYPADLLRVVIAVDARAPFTVAEYASAVGARASVVAGDEPGGKAAALNAGVRSATTDIVVFADSQQQFAPSAIGKLVGALADERLGAVSGNVVHVGDGLAHRYWQYELAIRESQAAVHSIICVSGAIYALRRALWVPLPAGLICDDLFVTMGVVRSGFRVGICTDALAYDSRRFSGEQHFDRKVRTMTGLLQLCAWTPAILAPWRNPIWVDFLFHKLMRIAAPYLFVLGVAGTGWWLLAEGGAVLRWIGAAGAVVALLAATVHPKVARVARSGLRLFTIPVLAARNALHGRWQVWQVHPAPAPAAAPAPAPRPRVTEGST